MVGVGVRIMSPMSCLIVTGYLPVKFCDSYKIAFLIFCCFTVSVPPDCSSLPRVHYPLFLSGPEKKGGKKQTKKLTVLKIDTKPLGQNTCQYETSVAWNSGMYVRRTTTLSSFKARCCCCCCFPRREAGDV